MKKSYIIFSTLLIILYIIAFFSKISVYNMIFNILITNISILSIFFILMSEIKINKKIIFSLIVLVPLLFFGFILSDMKTKDCLSQFTECEVKKGHLLEEESVSCWANVCNGEAEKFDVNELNKCGVNTDFNGAWFRSSCVI